MIGAVILWLVLLLPYVLSVTKINNRVLSLVLPHLTLVQSYPIRLNMQADLRMFAVPQQKSQLGKHQPRRPQVLLIRTKRSQQPHQLIQPQLPFQYQLALTNGPRREQFLHTYFLLTQSRTS